MRPLTRAPAKAGVQPIKGLCVWVWPPAFAGELYKESV